MHLSILTAGSVVSDTIHARPGIVSHAQEPGTVSTTVLVLRDYVQQNCESPEPLRLSSGHPGQT